MRTLSGLFFLILSTSALAGDPLPPGATARFGSAKLRHDAKAIAFLDAKTLAAMYDDARQASEGIAREEKIEVAWKKIWQIQPFPFHAQLIEMGDRARGLEEHCAFVRRNRQHRGQQLSNLARGPALVGFNLTDGGD